VFPGKWLGRGLVAVVALMVLLGALYAFVMWEGSSARGEVPAIEKLVAQWLLHRTIPVQDRDRKNPLNAQSDDADLSAGQEVYRKKCEICHAYNGSGKTEIAAG